MPITMQSKPHPPHLQMLRSVMQMQGISGQVQIALHLVFTALSMLVLPRVYPHITWPRWSLPLTIICAWIAWVTLPTSQSRNRAPSRANLAASATAGASTAAALAAVPPPHGRKKCRSSGEDGTAVGESNWGLGELTSPSAQCGTGSVSRSLTRQLSDAASKPPTDARLGTAGTKNCEQLTFDDVSDTEDCGGGEDGSSSWLTRSGIGGGGGALGDFASCRIFETGSSFGTSRDRLLETLSSIKSGPAVDESRRGAEMPLGVAGVLRSSSSGSRQAAVCSSQEELVCMMLTVRSRRYVSRVSTVTCTRAEIKRVSASRALFQMQACVACLKPYSKLYSICLFPRSIRHWVCGCSRRVRLLRCFDPAQSLCACARGPTAI